MAQKIQHIEPASVQESWTIIKMPNGDTIKSKHVVIGVIMTIGDDGTPVKNEDGSIVYGVIHSVPIVGIYPAEERKKQNEYL